MPTDTQPADGRKRICMVTSSALTVRWFLLDQLRALNRIYDVTLILNTEEPEWLRQAGVEVRILPVRIERKISPWRDLLALFDLMAVFKRERFDAVHSVTPKAGLLAMLAAWVCRVPVRIHTFQGEVWATRTGFMRQLLRFFDWLVDRVATQVLVVSESERQFLIGQGLVSLHSSRVLAKGSICGIDIQRFAPPTAKQRAALRDGLGLSAAGTVFLFVGRLAVDKGILDLVRAFDSLWRNRPDARLLIVGPDEEGVQDKVHALNLASTQGIRFDGFTPAPESYIGAADVLCLPSYREGFGMVLLEAGAMAVPVLASRIYGITDAVVDGETGLLHEPGAVHEIADKMAVLESAPALREQLGQQGLARVRRDFAQTYVTAEVVKFYAEMLAKF